MPTSSVTQHSSPAQSGRVSSPPRAYAALAEVATTTKPPDAVYVDPSGAHVAVQSDRFVDLVDAASGRVARDVAASTESESIVWMADRGFIFGETETLWDGARVPGRVFATGVTVRGRQLAARFVDDQWTSVGQELDSLQMPAQVAVTCAKGTPQAWHEGVPMWGAKFPGYAMPAIADDGTVALAFVDGRFVVLAADGDTKTSEAVTRLDEKLPDESYFVSALDGGYVVLAAVDVQGAAPGERNVRGLRARTAAFKGRWTTRVRRLDAKGATAWVVDVPFEARQPPIDGGGARVYVVGEGIAAIDDGKVVWSSRSATRMSATAFGDGTLAVAIGTQLRILARDGTVKQQLETPDASPITTVPAIAAGGTVWVATAKHLYAAR